MVFTQKEAVLKAAGVGLAEGLDEVQLSEIAINRQTLASYRGLTYRVISTFNDAHAVTVAVADPPQAAIASAPSPATPVALSHFQEGLCLNELARLDGRSYALTHRIRLRGTLDVSALRNAMDILDRQHDVLRLGFRGDGTGFTRPSTGASLTVIALDALAPEAADEQAETLSRDRVERHYLLDREPLYRALLLLLPERVNLLFINFHHLVMDCFCSFDYANALMKTYHLVQQGPTPEPGDDEVPQYAAFVARQRDRLPPDRIARLQRYWAEQLAGTTPVLLPAKPAAEPGVSHSDFRIGDQECALIEAYSRRAGVTTFIGLLSALQAALFWWLKRSDMIVGIPFSLKDRTTEARMLGPFVNLLPIRGAATEQTTWVDLSHGLRKALFDAIDHHDIPPVSLASISKANGQQPARVICQLIYAPEGEITVPDLEVERGVFDGYDAKQALVFTFFRESSGLRCAVTRNTQFVDPDELDRLIGRFLELVAQMYTAPDGLVPPP
ncbi:MAG: hypothetical protein IPG66_03120 [Hydrogenophilales bacterium]|nr:hypothetical protein [Hydrogenophilales bacterium]